MRIALAGNIGVGKSTLAKLMEQDNYIVVKEQQNDDVLSKIQECRERGKQPPEQLEIYNQAYFLLHTIERDLKLQLIDEKQNIVVDRPITDHLYVFAKTILDPHTYARYELAQKMLIDAIGFEKYDITFILTDTQENLFKKIKERGRSHENIEDKNYIDFYNKLNDIYNSEEFRLINREYAKNVVRINVTDKTPEQVYEEVKHIIELVKANRRNNVSNSKL